MRIRTIKPEFFKHDGLASLPPLTRLLFIGLWGMADCRGRLGDRPSRIKVEVLPYEQDYDIETGLSELANGGFVLRYEVDGQRVLQISNFSKHQRLSGRELEDESDLPAPPKHHPSKPTEETGKHSGSIREATRKQLGSTQERGREGKGRERKGMERKGMERKGAADAAPPAPKVASAPSIEDVQIYAQCIAFDGVIAARDPGHEHVSEFFDHYSANGWRQGQGQGRPIRDWRAAFRQWVRRSRQGFGSGRGSGKNNRGDPAAASAPPEALKTEDDLVRCGEILVKQHSDVLAGKCTVEEVRARLGVPDDMP